MKESRPNASFPCSRRKFIAGSGAAVTAFAIAPRHVLGGPRFIAPNEKITMALIGCGTQGLRELPALLGMPEIRVVAVCDPVRESQDYVDWSSDGLRRELAAALGKPDWRKAEPGIPGGREVAREVIESFYSGKARAQSGHCACYADFRELLDKEKDLAAVKIMTPDHLHATIAIAAMKKGKHVLLHKPMANRLHEARLVIKTARQTGVATHFLPASQGENICTIKSWIDSGTIGKLREIHNWSNRPVWPQYPAIPAERPPIPHGFDWNLWLGPCLDRPYHPHYTHAVFRGWYEFGGGALADMGHYSLWPVFREFDLDSPVWVESSPAHLCTLAGNVSTRIRNDYSFPAACTIRFRFGAKGDRGPLDLFWYDGSMKPPAPPELEQGDSALAPEGMMFVGDKGRILADFRGENPRVLSGLGKSSSSPPALDQPARRERGRRQAADSWSAAFKGGPATYGNFLLAGPISDAFNLAAVSLRMGGKRLLFDADNAVVKNSAEANGYLTRDYRKGWELR